MFFAVHFAESMLATRYGPIRPKTRLQFSSYPFCDIQLEFSPRKRYCTPIELGNLTNMIMNFAIAALSLELPGNVYMYYFDEGFAISIIFGHFQTEKAGKSTSMAIFGHIAKNLRLAVMYRHLNIRSNNHTNVDY